MQSTLIGDKAFYKKTFSIMLPILAQNVITNFVNLLDNLMVGQVGTEPMSGVAIVNELMFVFNICVFGCIEGADIFTSQFYGSKNLDGVRSSFRFKLIFLSCNLLLFSAAFTFWGDELIRLFIHEGSGDVDPGLTFQYARQYLKVVMIQMVPFSIVQLYSGTLKCSGKTVIPMKAGITAVCVNALFNYLLIFGKFGFPQLGVVGAALATVLAKVVEMAIVVIWTHTHREEAPFICGVYSSLKIPSVLLSRMAVMSIPLFLNEILWSFGTTFQSQSFSTRGIDVVPAVNITNTVNNLFSCAMFALGNTIAIMVGHRLGAGQLKEAVEEDRRLIIMSVCLCAVLGLIMGLLAPYIPQAYNTTDSVRLLATQLLRVASVMIPINALVNTCYFTLRSGGKAVFIFLFDSGFVCGVLVPAAFILSRFTDIGIVPLFAIVHGLNILKGILGVIMVRKKVWVNNIVESD
ncbi:MAG: MATE family efflux transporter [Firmicutes bacterium]|nr:MATE family efflux transporter [Bacillota bacterium]